jgi:DNA processing protein
MSQLHWVALTSAARIGGKTITRLLEHFGSLEAVFEATPGQLQQVSGIGPKTAAAITQIDLGRVETELIQFKETGLQIVTWEDRDGYPTNLLRTDDAPPVLFVKGSLSPSDTRAVAIVGTRRPDQNASRLAHDLACELAARGWTIVSGLALGIDTAAHRGALAAKGRTLAVLGSGLLRIYPDQNVPLAGDVSEHGALLSEFHPQATVNAQNLVARNRITSGLCKAVIVAQAHDDSGSVSTARRAWKQNRAVFAVTGGDAGCENLIKQGAMPIDPQHVDYDQLSSQIEQTG